MLGVDESCCAALLLDRGDGVHGQRGLAAALRPEHLQQQPPPQQLAQKPGEAMPLLSVPIAENAGPISNTASTWSTPQDALKKQTRQWAAMWMCSHQANELKPAVRGKGGPLGRQRAFGVQQGGAVHLYDAAPGEASPRAMSSVKAPQEMCSLCLTCTHRLSGSVRDAPTKI